MACLLSYLSPQCLSVYSLTAQDKIGYEYSLQLIPIINERELAFESVAFYRILNGLPPKKKIIKKSHICCRSQENKRH